MTTVSNTNDNTVSDTNDNTDYQKESLRLLSKIETSVGCLMWTVLGSIVFALTVGGCTAYMTF